MIGRLSAWYGKAVYLAYLLSRVNWWSLLTGTNADASTVVWVCQMRSAGSLKHYLLDNHFLNDLALVAAFMGSGVPFMVKTGRPTGELVGKRVFYTISRQFNLFALRDHAKPMLEVVGDLERRGSLLLPTLKEASFWENKVHMHREFERLGIRCPQTWIVESGGVDALKPFRVESYPLLLKEVHSAGSEGLMKIDDFAMLEAEVEKRFATGHTELLVQRLLDIRRDLRVILVDGRIVLHYWRINQAKQWKPTSTGQGSSVDFVSFPEKWREWIIGSFDRLGITTGAFDVTWDRDDTESEPYILEVSPAYMPNPPQPANLHLLSYSQYKKVLWPKPQYLFDYVDVVFRIKREVVEAYLRKFPHPEI